MKFNVESRWNVRDTLWKVEVIGTTAVFNRIDIAGVEFCLANRGTESPMVVQYSVFIPESCATKHLTEKSLVDSGYATSKDEAIILCRSKLQNDKNEKILGYKRLIDEEAELCQKRMEVLDKFFGVKE